MADPTSTALLPTYARQNLVFERGEGVWLITRTGDRYLDFTGGVAVSALGHAHPKLVAALTEQAGKLWHTSNLFRIANQETLAESLVRLTFADRVFFSNSGAEAMEGCIKIARRYHYVNGAPERFRVITFEGAFHGRTLATIAAGNQKKHLEGFGPKVDGFDNAQELSIAAVEKAMTPETAAVLIEPIQGEGGIRAVPPGFLRELRDYTARLGLLLILDEIQCGMGRTGKLFAHEWVGITPDIMGIAKGLGGGFPIGAVLATEEAAKGMTAGTHGSTFGGNPLATAVGCAVVDTIAAPGFLEDVARKGLLLKQRLAELKDLHGDVIEEVRGEGLMLGIKVRPPVTNVIAAMTGEKLLAVPAGDNVVRLLPALIVSDEEIGEAVRRLGRAVASFGKAAA
jgi:acetylornithine/N-succinyldiaminopimelate aminotransferase